MALVLKVSLGIDKNYSFNHGLCFGRLGYAEQFLQFLRLIWLNIPLGGLNEPYQPKDYPDS